MRSCASLVEILATFACTLLRSCCNGWCINLVRFEIWKQAGGIAAISRFMEQDEENETDLDCSSHEVVVTCMSTLKDACRNHEQNRDAFIYKNMAQVKA